VRLVGGKQRTAGVYVNPDVPRVTAMIWDEAGKPLATRTWDLDPEIGLLVHCFCGEDDCPLRHQEIMPAPPGEISAQIEGEVRRFCEEFGVKAAQIHYGTGNPDEPTPLPRLVLRGKWEDIQTIVVARASCLVRAALRERSENT